MVCLYLGPKMYIRVLAGKGNWTYVTRVDLEPGFLFLCPHKYMIHTVEDRGLTMARFDRLNSRGIGPCNSCLDVFLRANMDNQEWPRGTLNCKSCQKYREKIRSRVFSLLPKGVNPFEGGSSSTLR